MFANAGTVFNESSVMGLANLLIARMSTIYQMGLDDELLGSGCSEFGSQDVESGYPLRTTEAVPIMAIGFALL